jgi:hypothetical protein
VAPAARAQRQRLLHERQRVHVLVDRLVDEVRRAVDVVRLVEHVPREHAAVAREAPDDAAHVRAEHALVRQRVDEDVAAGALHPRRVVQVRVGRALAAGLGERVPHGVEQHEHRPDLVPVGHRQELVDAPQEALRVLAVGEVVQEHAHRVHAERLGVAELAVDGLRVPRGGLHISSSLLAVLGTKLLPTSQPTESAQARARAGVHWPATTAGRSRASGARRLPAGRALGRGGRRGRGGLRVERRGGRGGHACHGSGGEGGAEAAQEARHAEVGRAGGQRTVTRARRPAMPSRRTPRGVSPVAAW